MAGFTLTAQQTFPNSTSVGAFPVSNWPAHVDPTQTEAAPIGSATNSQTMTSGTLTFTGLTAGVDYVAYAQVGGVHRYIRFTAGADTAGTGSKIDPALVDAKGDLLVGTADNTVARKAVGADGAALIADSSQGDGLRWGATFPNFYRLLFATQGTGASGQTAASYVLGTNNGSGVMIASGGNAIPFSGLPGVPSFDFVAADHAVTGLTTKLRLRAQASTAATAPAITFTFGLYPLTSGGATTFQAYTLGTVVPGSTVAHVSPGTNGIVRGNSGDFTIPRMVSSGWESYSVERSRPTLRLT